MMPQSAPTSPANPSQAVPKIIVLDDDPTGSQTVHSCLLLLQWDVDTLVLGLEDASPIFFVLTNTRSLSPQAATAVTTEVCQNLKQALTRTGITNYLLVSRSDSTLRGHYPIETDVIASHLGPFDAHFLTPAFFEGGRVTIDSTHYIETNGQRIPTHDTEFAKDSVFGYSTSYLPRYVEEKTAGKIPASAVEQFTLQDIRTGTLERLLALSNNQCVAVDGEQQSDLDKFAADLLSAAAQGKKFLFRSAAGLLTSLANLPPQPTPAEEMYLRSRGPVGAIVVGSHVKKTTQQLEQLLQLSDIVGIEIDVARIKSETDSQTDNTLQEREFTLLESTLAKVLEAQAAGNTPAIFTSRTELTFPDKQARLRFGEAVSSLLMNLIKALPADLGFLISKGGITSNDTLSKGLALRSVRLLGQIIPGVSVVITSADHPQFPNLPVVLFPGNVGDEQALATAYQRLHGQSEEGL
ncbi:MAG: four-carbon acid sugar kinase family protein [Cyanobacteria bacterium J06623_4]